MASPSTVVRLPRTPPEKPRPLNYKNWVSIVGLFNAPGFQPKSFACTTLPPSPGPSLTNPFTVHTIWTGVGTGKRMRDRYNLPHTDTRVGASPSPSHLRRVLGVRRRLTKFPAVSVSVPRPPLGSSKEWNTFSWGGEGARSRPWCCGRG